MSNLKDILRRSTEQTLKLGGGSDRLIQELRTNRKRQFNVFVVLFLVLVCGLALCVYLVIRNQTEQARLVAGLFGIGTGGAIEAMRRVWKDWSQTDLLLILLEDANEAQIAKLVDQLSQKL
jgi:hypothetical protein